MNIRNFCLHMHLYLAAFVAPVFVLFGLSGGLFLLDIRGEVTRTPVELSADATLDFQSETLEDDVRALLADHGISHRFETINRPRLPAGGGGFQRGAGFPGGAGAGQAGDQGGGGFGRGGGQARGQGAGGPRGGGFGRGAGGPGAAQATVIQTRPTSRTSYQFRYQNGTLTATRATPNLQRSLMELHKGHGPSLFTTYQKLVALALILVVLSGVWMGLASKVLRKKTGLVSLAGLVVFILAGFVI